MACTVTISPPCTARSNSTVQQHGPTAWSNSMVQQHGPTAWSNSTVQQHGPTARSNSMVQQHGPTAWSNSMVQQHGPTARSNSTVQQHGPGRPQGKSNGPHTDDKSTKYSTHRNQCPIVRSLMIHPQYVARSRRNTCEVQLSAHSR